MTFNWNIVTRNLHGLELPQSKVRAKITNLEKHLKHFPPDAVHLHIALQRHPRKEEHTAALTLRVPSNILHSTKSAQDVIAAFDLAFSSLLRELELFKSALRGERLWKRKDRREHVLKAAGFNREPQPEGSGPQDFEDVVRDLWRHHYNLLLRHARRDIRYEELSGGIPPNALDAREIVDEAARRAIANAAKRPRDMRWMTWLYHLIHEELKRQRHLLKEKQAREVSIERRAALAELGEQSLHPLEQLVEEVLEPEAIRIEDIVPSSAAVPPDEIAAQKEALEQLQRDLKNWPRSEREVFELHYIEGLEAEEITQITQRPIQQVKEILAVLRQRLHRALLEDVPA